MKNVIFLKKQWVRLLLGVFFVVGCSQNDTVYIDKPLTGNYSKKYISSLKGFIEQKNSILSKNNMSLNNFILWSVEPAWDLSEDRRTALKSVRESVAKPTNKTLFQKVIPLEDVLIYMNNTYGGTVGGFVCVAADIKQLSTLSSIYWGLRLDYPGSKFKINGGAGYAVIRFTNNNINNLEIPYCKEMGGQNEHAWPSTGGGFTASKLGNGGFPEYNFTGYYSPNEGAELYEITPNGLEILRSVFKTGCWVVYEGERIPSVKTPDTKTIRNGLYAEHGGKEYAAYYHNDGKIELVSDVNIEGFSQNEQTNRYFKIVTDKEITKIKTINTFTLYKGSKFNVRGEDKLFYYLTTTDLVTAHKLDLETIERGVYGVTLSKNNIQETWEENI